MKRITESHKNIPPDLMAAYIARKITSKELGEKTGYHPVYLRRSIERDPRPEREAPDDSHKKLLEARIELHKSVANLPIAQIVKRAHVSTSTAARIKKRYKVTP